MLFDPDHDMRAAPQPRAVSSCDQNRGHIAEHGSLISGRKSHQARFPTVLLPHRSLDRPGAAYCDVFHGGRGRIMVF
jgi:hypothetical protein